MVDDGVYMMDNNFTYSKEVLEYAIGQNAAFIYASTAAVYGLSGEGRFTATSGNERPLNIYGFSKLVFDQHVRNLIERKAISNTVVGLRYFNVFGPRETHKERMSSVIHHFSKQIRETGRVDLFEGSGGYADGEQRRDFVYVRDLARLNLFFAQVGPYASTGQPGKIYQGIANAGSGQSRSFNEVARALIKIHGKAVLQYVPFPPDLNRRYQHFTEADLTDLRNMGCDLEFTPLEVALQETFSPTEPGER